MNDEDHPVRRFRDTRFCFRDTDIVAVRQWSDRAKAVGPVQCRLCPDGVGFLCREDWVDHAKKVHGGVQRYRNALFTLLSLKPYTVRGQEWRALNANFSEFFSRASLDWERFTPEMRREAGTQEGLGPKDRWAPRHRAACVFCCRLYWYEDLFHTFLVGSSGFMAAPRAVAELLSPDRYSERWPLIPMRELLASSVDLRLDASTGESKKVLLHKRRVSSAAAAGEAMVNVCEDCYEAFRGKKPWLCKFCLANDMWLGRWSPLFPGR